MRIKDELMICKEAEKCKVDCSCKVVHIVRDSYYLPYDAQMNKTRCIVLKNKPTLKAGDYFYDYSRQATYEEKVKFINEEDLRICKHYKHCEIRNNLNSFWACKCDGIHYNSLNCEIQNELCGKKMHSECRRLTKGEKKEILKNKELFIRGRI